MTIIDCTFGMSRLLTPDKVIITLPSSNSLINIAWCIQESGYRNICDHSLASCNPRFLIIISFFLLHSKPDIANKLIVIHIIHVYIWPKSMSRPFNNEHCLLGNFLLTGVLLLLREEQEELMTCSSMEKSVTTLEKHETDILKVVGKHRRLGYLLRTHYQVMDVFHCLERFLWRETDNL